MKKLLALAVLALCFTGCFSFTEEITQEPDNTYTLSRTVSMGTAMFDMLASFKMIGDTTGLDSVTARRQLIDSMRTEFSGLDESITKLPGYISSAIRDTIIDTMYYITTTVRVREAMKLPPFHESLWQTMNKESKSEKEKLALVISKKNGKTYFSYVFPALDKKDMKKSKKEKEEAKQFLKDIHIYFRFISPNLEPPAPKSGMKFIPGGQEYELPLVKIIDGKALPKKVEFVINK
jgi:hypothetical protein